MSIFRWADVVTAWTVSLADHPPLTTLVVCHVTPVWALGVFTLIAYSTAIVALLKLCLTRRLLLRRAL